MAKAKPKAKVLAKVVHLGLGLDLIGSKTTVSNKQAELEVGPLGIHMRSKKTGRVVLLPWANIKGCEMMPESPDAENKDESPDGEDNA